MITTDNLDRVLCYFLDIFPKTKSVSVISNFFSKVDNDLSIIQYVKYLIDNKYLYHEKVDKESINFDSQIGMTIVGMLLFERTAISRRPLYARELEEKSEKEKALVMSDMQFKNVSSEKWVKKYWWLMLIIGWVGGCWTDIAKDGIKRKLWPENKVNENAKRSNVSPSVFYRSSSNR